MTARDASGAITGRRGFAPSLLLSLLLSLALFGSAGAPRHGLPGVQPGAAALTTASAPEVRAILTAASVLLRAADPLEGGDPYISRPDWALAERLAPAPQTALARAPEAAPHPVRASRPEARAPPVS